MVTSIFQLRSLHFKLVSIKNIGPEFVVSVIQILNCTVLLIIQQLKPKDPSLKFKAILCYQQHTSVTPRADLIIIGH
jgi:hypothetical protein